MRLWHAAHTDDKFRDALVSLARNFKDFDDLLVQAGLKRTTAKADPIPQYHGTENITVTARFAHPIIAAPASSTPSLSVLIPLRHGLPHGINSNIESLIEASGNKLVQFCSTVSVRVRLVASYNSSGILR